MGFRPRVLVAVVILSTIKQSSKFIISANFCDRPRIACLVFSPVLICAAADRALPASVIGPLFRPPCVVHLKVRLDLRAGLRHWLPLLTDLAVHLRHVILPPAVDRYFSIVSPIFHIMKLNLLYEISQDTCKLLLGSIVLNTCILNSILVRSK